MIRFLLIWLVGLATVALLIAQPHPRSASRMDRGVPQDGAGVTESTTCARCHSFSPDARALRDSTGKNIAPYDLWRSSMMANAARDPLWRAAVSVEVAATPSARAAIESKCLRCHAPMAERVGLEEHGSGSLMHVLDCESPLGDLARDGVSCTTCHGISPEGLGTEDSFTAGFELDPDRRIFGPHEQPFPQPMRGQSGFTPTYSGHIVESKLCGSCHTLVTPTVDEGGQATGHRFLEQSPYLEWRNSAFRAEGDRPGPMATHCQGCHVPTRDARRKTIRTRIARDPDGPDFSAVVPREPFGRHVFVGGNTLILSLLRDHAEELGVVAPREAFEATIAAAREQLERRTASIRIEAVERRGETLAFEVQVANLTGHKLPTGHPTRRMWLRVAVRDEAGNLVFSSGFADEAGRILGVDGKPLAIEEAQGPIEPHRPRITAGDEVAIYQAVMADSNGRPTHILMRGASWYQDNRLLPMGWSADHEEAVRTAPAGIREDSDFSAGSDRVQYRLPIRTSGSLTIEVSLLYQSLSARWAAELFAWDTPEVAAFKRMYEHADRTPVVLASAEVTTAD